METMERQASYRVGDEVSFWRGTSMAFGRVSATAGADDPACVEVCIVEQGRPLYVEVSPDSLSLTDPSEE